MRGAWLCALHRRAPGRLVPPCRRLRRTAVDAQRRRVRDLATVLLLRGRGGRQRRSCDLGRRHAQDQGGVCARAQPWPRRRPRSRDLAQWLHEVCARDVRYSLLGRRDVRAEASSHRQGHVQRRRGGMEGQEAGSRGQGLDARVYARVLRPGVRPPRRHAQGPPCRHWLRGHERAAPGLHLTSLALLVGLSDRPRARVLSLATAIVGLGRRARDDGGPLRPRLPGDEA